MQLETLTIRAVLAQSFARFADCPALAFAGDHPLRYGELQNRVLAIANLFLRLHVNSGDRIALLGENSPNWVIAYLAATTIGITAVPILPGFADGDIHHIIRHCGAVAVCIDGKMQHKIEGMDRSALLALINLDDFGLLEANAQPHGFIEKARQLFKHEKKVAQEYAEFSALPMPQESDVAAIIYTSGTTGLSKGVILTQRNIAFDIVHAIERFPISTSDRFLSILPLSHTYEATGGLLCPLAAGVSIFYMRGLPTPQKLLEAMQQVQPTGVLAVPLVMEKIYRKRILPQLHKSMLLRALHKRPFFRRRLHAIAGRKLKQTLGGALRFFMFGGAAISPDVEEFLQHAGIGYSTGYGMTETSPIMTINPFGAVRAGSCGLPISGIEMAIAEPDDETGIGEITVRGDIVMSGYYHNPEATAAVMREGGWLHTGDVGRFDHDGYLYITGRCKNVIIGASGENIYPEAIEQILAQHNLIQEALVYADGERLIAKAYLDPDALDLLLANDAQSEEAVHKQKAEALAAICRQTNQHLPRFSQLAAIVDHPEPFEKTPTNKIKRYLYIPGAQPGRKE